jgi:hypothetical protein
MAARILTAMLWMPWFVVSGCGKGPDQDAVPGRTNAPAPERPWAEQVQDVRDGRSTQVRVESPSISSAEWNELSDGCAALKVLEVANAELPDDALQVVAALPNLTRLKLGAPIGDAGAAHLAAAQQLEVLNLPAADLTDAGLALLATLPRLQLLRFKSPRVSDAGLSHVAGMPSLRFLHLIDVPVTDAGLAHLHAMTWLESFYLDGGRCTDEGLSALLKALPNVHFHKDQLHLPGDRHAHPHDQ